MTHLALGSSLGSLFGLFYGSGANQTYKGRSRGSVLNTLNRSIYWMDTERVFRERTLTFWGA